MNHTGSVFTFANSSTLSFKHSTKINLPIATDTVPQHKKPTWIMNAYMKSSRLNISKAQEELLYWHNIFVNYNIQRTHALFKSMGENLDPVVTPKLPATKTCSIPPLSTMPTWKR